MNSVTVSCQGNCAMIIDLSRMLEEKMFQLFFQGVSCAEACHISLHCAFNLWSSRWHFCRNLCVLQLNSTSNVCRVSVCEGSPLGELYRCVQERIRVKVHIRTFKGLRGVCSGFVVAFDKFWNMVSSCFSFVTASPCQSWNVHAWINVLFRNFTMTCFYFCVPRQWWM